MDTSLKDPSNELTEEFTEDEWNEVAESLKDPSNELTEVAPSLKNQSTKNKRRKARISKFTLEEKESFLKNKRETDQKYRQNMHPDKKAIFLEKKRKKMAQSRKLSKLVQLLADLDKQDNKGGSSRVRRSRRRSRRRN